MNLLKISLSAFLVIIFPGYVSSECAVYLKNDRIIKADSCRKDGSKVELLKGGLTVVVGNHLIREIDENHVSPKQSTKLSSEKKVSGNSKIKNSNLAKKAESLGGSDKNKTSEIMKQAETIKKAYGTIDKKPEDF